MKRIILATAILALTGAVSAQTVNTQSQATSQTTSAAQNAGNAQNITFQSDASGNQRIKSAPAIGGAGFYGSFSSDFCYGTAGGAGSIVGIGASITAMVYDEKCGLFRGVERTMQVSANVAAAGDVERGAKLRQAATDMLCQVSDEMAKALRAQDLCTDLTPKQIAVNSRPPTAAEQEAGYTGNDPIVRKRLGLPPL